MRGPKSKIQGILPWISTSFFLNHGLILVLGGCVRVAMFLVFVTLVLGVSVRNLVCVCFSDDSV